MKKVSDTIYTMLREVDEICRKEAIPYILSPELSRIAALGMDLNENPLSGIVYIHMKDMERFREAAERNMPEKRALDSMEVNKRFPGFFFFYSATDTVCYCFNRGRNYRDPGIGIYICPLRPSEIPGARYRWISKLENGWKNTCDLYGETVTSQDILPICLTRLMGLFMTRKRLGRFIFRQLCLCGRNRNSADTLTAEKGCSEAFSSSLLNKLKKVRIRETEFSVPAGLGKYLSAQYGKGWRRYRRKEFIPSNVWLVSPLLSYKELFDTYPWIQRKSSDRRKLFVKSDALGEQFKAGFEELWADMKQLEAGLKLESFYLKRLDYIRNLLESRDIQKLKKIFKPLDSWRKAGPTAYGDRHFSDSVMELYDAYHVLVQ